MKRRSLATLDPNKARSQQVEEGGDKATKRSKQTTTPTGRGIEEDEDSKSVDSSTTLRKPPKLKPNSLTTSRRSSTRSSARKSATSCESTRPRIHPPDGVEDIDQRQDNNPCFAPQYAPEVYSFLRDLQFRYGEPGPDTLKLSRPGNRAKLVEWIVEVVEDLQMSSDVLYVSVDMIDRILRATTVPSTRLQLLGCACMLLASKFEDVFFPSLEDFVNVSDAAFSVAELLEMENHVLKQLDFRLMSATAKPFLRRCQLAGMGSPQVKHMSNYICELSLTSIFFQRFTPSLVAAAAVHLARILLHKRPKRRSSPNSIWTPELVHYSGYVENQLAFVVQHLWTILSTANVEITVRSIYRKYESHERMEVSLLRFPSSFETLLPEITEEAFTTGGL